jgi:8-oxo-dGTP diphosphatase
MEFKDHKSINANNEEVDLTIASGPVIIEDGKVLLDKHGQDDFWKFPGGRIRDNESMWETAVREAKEELGIEVELEGEPVTVVFGSDEKYIILIHYKAKRSGEPSPGRDVREWAWHDVDNLPEDCAPNIKPVLARMG